MRVIVRSPPGRGRRPSPRASADEPRLQLLAPWTSPWQDFLEGLRAVLDSRRPIDHPFQDIFPYLFLGPGRMRRSLLASALTHLAVVVVIWNLPSAILFLERPHPLVPQTPYTPQHITWYRVIEALPAISPEPKRPGKPASLRGKRPAPARKGASQFHEQQIVISNPPQPDNTRQTIFQPDLPNVRINHDVRIPNLVLWSEAQRPAPPADMSKLPIARLRMPADLVRPKVDAPIEPDRNLGDLKMAEVNPLLSNPRLPVPPAAPTPPAPPPSVDPAPAGATVGGWSGDPGNQLRRLIAISANPAPPGGPIEVPPGNRSGAFSVGPGKEAGSPNGSPAGIPEGGGGGSGLGGDGAGGGGGNGLRVPGLYVNGKALPLTGAPVVVAAPPPPPPPAPRPLMDSPLPKGMSSPERASIPLRPSRPQLPEWKGGGQTVEPGFSPGKRIYTVYINMPNLASGAGSWILRFAELQDRRAGDEEELAAPVATRKVDPGYVPSAVRDKVEGQVVLHAVIRRDGHVERIEVLRSLDPRLDERAIQALLRWQFQPATRNGAPVDLEAVVHIPFVLPRAF